MITTHLDLIEKKRIKLKVKRADLASKTGVQADTLFHFLKTHKQLKKDLALISRLCAVLGLDWKRVIK